MIFQVFFLPAFLIDPAKQSIKRDGFANSLKYTTSTAETTAEAGEFVRITQKIEGQDIQQFKYGTSGAQAVTLSFWVKSSITGTYAVSIYCDHSAQARLYGDTYTIDSANTWEYKTITITGDTVGIPDDDNGEKKDDVKQRRLR